VSEASNQFTADDRLQPRRIANTLEEALASTLERRHLLQCDDVSARFIEDGRNSSRVETPVPADASMDVVRDEL
jgi:hypothetical protein